MKSKIEFLGEKYKSLVESDFMSFDEVVLLKNTMGVYVIYNHLKEIIYVGNTNKFNVRFGTDLKHESTHTLVMKFIKFAHFEDRYQVVDYLKTKCAMKIEICDSKREAEALEGIAIYCMNPYFNKE